MTREEVGRKLGISEWEVTRIERLALKKLSNNLKARKLYELAQHMRSQLTDGKQYRMSKIAK